MSDALSRICPFCERHSHFTLRWGHIYANGDMVRFCCTCDSCGELSMGRRESESVSAGHTDLGQVRAAIDMVDEPIEWWPAVGDAPDILDVPTEITRAAREAYSSASVGNHMAAILMARTVVEATAKHLGIKKGTLVSKINEMRDGNHIRPAIAEQAHEVRFSGNDMAHGDIDVAPDAVDAEEILALMAEVLSEVFQGPARLERIRAKRQSKQGS